MKMKHKEILPGFTISENKLRSVFDSIRDIAKTEHEENNLWGTLLNLNWDELNAIFCSSDRVTTYLAMKNKAILRTKELETSIPVRVVI